MEDFAGGPEARRWRLEETHLALLGDLSVLELSDSGRTPYLGRSSITANVACNTHLVPTREDKRLLARICQAKRRGTMIFIATDGSNFTRPPAYVRPASIVTFLL